jgi:hypothetical protein
LLSRLAGESIRHIRDEFTTQKEIKRQASEGSRASKPSAGNFGR